MLATFENAETNARCYARNYGTSMQKFHSVKGSLTADQFFCEELHRLGIEKQGLIGLWQNQQLHTNKPVPTKEISQTLFQNTSKLTRGRNMPRRSSCTDLNEGCDLHSDPALENLRARFLVKFQTNNSFRRRISSSKIGLLFTDAASTIMTQSFLERSLCFDLT